MIRRLALTAVAVVGIVSAAEALTVRDVIELAKAGVGEEVLLALIEVDGRVYTLDPDTLKSMKQAGVPERVIAAMIRSGRERPEPPPPVEPDDPPAPQPHVVVIDHHEPPQVREVVVPVPVYIPVAVPPVRHRGVIQRTRIESTYVPFQSGPPAERLEEPKSEPVYWGFGGKRRPDAWKPDGYQPEKDSRERNKVP